MTQPNGKKVVSVQIIGRRWFQRSYGNTYHTAEIVVNGETVHALPKQYGYGDQYLHNALEWLQQNGYMPGYRDADHAHEFPREFFARQDVTYMYSVSDVKRERDL